MTFQIFGTKHLGVDTVEPVAIVGGWHIKVRDDGQCCIDVLRMLYNFRVTISPAQPEHEYVNHGWCYFGHGVDANGAPRTMQTALLAAMAAALAWDGYGKPAGYDKEAF